VTAFATMTIIIVVASTMVVTAVAGTKKISNTFIAKNANVEILSVEPNQKTVKLVPEHVDLTRQSTRAMATVTMKTITAAANMMAEIAAVSLERQHNTNIAKNVNAEILSFAPLLLTARHALDFVVLKNTKVMAIVMITTTIAVANMMAVIVVESLVSLHNTNIARNANVWIQRRLALLAPNALRTVRHQNTREMAFVMMETTTAAVSTMEEIVVVKLGSKSNSNIATKRKDANVLIQNINRNKVKSIPLINKE